MKVVLYEDNQPMRVIELACAKLPLALVYSGIVYMRRGGEDPAYDSYSEYPVYVVPQVGLKPQMEPSPSLRIIYPDGHESKTVYAKAGFLFEVPSVRLVARGVKADRGSLCGDDWAEDDDNRSQSPAPAAKSAPSQASPGVELSDFVPTLMSTVRLRHADGRHYKFVQVPVAVSHRALVHAGKTYIYEHVVASSYEEAAIRNALKDAAEENG